MSTSPSAFGSAIWLLQPSPAHTNRLRAGTAPIPGLNLPASQGRTIVRWFQRELRFETAMTRSAWSTVGDYRYCEFPAESARDLRVGVHWHDFTVQGVSRQPDRHAVADLLYAVSRRTYAKVLMLQRQIDQLKLSSTLKRRAVVTEVCKIFTVGRAWDQGEEEAAIMRRETSAGYLARVAAELCASGYMPAGQAG